MPYSLRGSLLPLHSLLVLLLCLNHVEDLVCAAKGVPKSGHGTETGVHSLLALVVEVVHVTPQHARQPVPDGIREWQTVA